MTERLTLAQIEAEERAERLAVEAERYAIESDEAEEARWDRVLFRKARKQVRVSYSVRPWMNRGTE